jgi:hypothetical protein
MSPTSKTPITGTREPYWRKLRRLRRYNIGGFQVRFRPLIHRRQEPRE